MSKILISIIVPCRNESKYIESAISSILSQKNVPGEYEIIVADGQSDDCTYSILERLAATESRLRIIKNPKRIVSSGLNLAIIEARGEIIIRMDSHSIFDQYYVSSCLNALLNSGADNVGGPACTRADSYMQQANGVAYHSPFAVGGALFHDTSYEGWVDTVTYGCWRKTTLLRLGLFDEKLVRNQDDELNYRIIRSGGRIWQTPKIRSWYYPRSNLSGIFQQYMQYGYWKVRVIQKHRVPASLRHLVPGTFVALVLGFCLLSTVSSLAAFALACLLGAYLTANIIATLMCCGQRLRWKYIPTVPLVFAAYHFGYGWGFLGGLVDFYLFKRGEDRLHHSKLTR